MSLDLSGSFMDDLKAPGVCFMVGTIAILLTSWFWQGVLLILVGFGLIVTNDRLRMGLASVSYALNASNASPGNTDAFAKEISKMSQDSNYVKKNDEGVIDVKPDLYPGSACCYDCYVAGCDANNCGCFCHGGQK